jgi:hypothetical protein
LQDHRSSHGIGAIAEFCEIAGMTPLLDRVSIDPRVCFGKPCIKGTRIRVSLFSCEW